MLSDGGKPEWWQVIVAEGKHTAKGIDTAKGKHTTEGIDTAEGVGFPGKP